MLHTCRGYGHYKRDCPKKFVVQHTPTSSNSTPTAIATNPSPDHGSSGGRDSHHVMLDPRSNKLRWRPDNPGAMRHSNIKGPFRVKSIRGCYCWLTYSGFTFLYFLRFKSDALVYSGLYISWLKTLCS